MEDIFTQLSLKNPLKFRASCFRSNLFYDVRFKESLDDEYEDLKDWVVECLGPDWEDQRVSTVDLCRLIDFIFAWPTMTASKVYFYH